jgi:hypothetical protein
MQAEKVRRDTELAFVLNQAEVLFSGLRAVGQGGRSSRISVRRGHEVLLEAVFDPARTASSAPGGRLPPFDAERSQHLHGVAAADLLGSFVELPDAFDPRYFQSAPPVQRLNALNGGDVIVLHQLYPGHEVVELTIPKAQIVGQGKVLGRSLPISFRLDTVVVEADRHVCTLLWRGRVAASRRETLAETRAEIEFTLLEPGRVRAEGPGWAQHGGAPGRPSFDSTVLISQKVDLFGTVVTTEGAAGADPLPFAPAEASPRSETPAGDIPGAPWTRDKDDVSTVVSPSARFTQTIAVAGDDIHDDVETLRPSSTARTEPQPPSTSTAERVVTSSAAVEEDDAAEQAAVALAAAAKVAAEARRSAEAEKFAAEQAALLQAEAEQKKRARERRAEKVKEIQTAKYGGFKRKK